MKYTFNAYGHPNMRGQHRNTLEFIKEKELSVNGDCIIGIGADFKYSEIKKLLCYGKLRMTLAVGKFSDVVEFEVNKNFGSKSEIVLRLGDFESERTLGFQATKSSKMLFRKLMGAMQKLDVRMKVELEPIVKVLIFDLDDTLEDFRGPKLKAHARLAKEFLKEFGIYPPTTMELLEQIDRDFVLSGVGKGPEYFYRKYWFIDFFKEVGVEVSSRKVDGFVKLYWEEINKNIKLMPGVLRMLTNLRKRYKIVLMSDADGPRSVKEKRLKVLGVENSFDFVIFGNDVNANKPSRKFYDKIFAKFGVDGTECVMVGDKPWADLCLANELGMKTVLMKHGTWANGSVGDSDYVDFVIDDIRKVEKIVSNI